jgi:hypothetical protein
MNPTWMTVHLLLSYAYTLRKAGALANTAPQWRPALLLTMSYHAIMAFVRQTKRRLNQPALSLRMSNTPVGVLDINRMASEA